MSERIKELEKELAEEKAKEAKNLGFSLVVFNDNEELEEIKIKTHELTSKEQAEILSNSEALYANLDEIEQLFKKLESGEATNKEVFKLMFLIDEPLKIIMSLFFDVEKNKIATIPNVDLFLTLLNGSEFAEFGDKTSKLAKEIDYMENK